MKSGHNKDKIPIGTILIKSFTDDKNNPFFKTVIGGFETRCPTELKDNEIIKLILELNQKMKERVKINPNDEYITDN